MAQILLTAAGLIFVVLGTLHGLLTLRDIANPRAFTPSDPAVRGAMQGAQVRFNRRLNLWDAWLGFNLSHSLGVIIGGAGLLLFAWPCFPTFAESRLVQAFAAGIPAAYLAVSHRFWFWGPTLGACTALLCVLAAIASL